MYSENNSKLSIQVRRVLNHKDFNCTQVIESEVWGQGDLYIPLDLKQSLTPLFIKVSIPKFFPFEKPEITICPSVEHPALEYED